MSVPEQKSQIKIEQQPYDDSVTVKHLQQGDREKERLIMGCKGQMQKQVRGGWVAVNSETMQNIRGNRATKSESVNKMQMSERFRATKNKGEDEEWRPLLCPPFQIVRVRNN